MEATGGNVICERAVYWAPPGGSTWQVGHDSIGVNNPASTWYLAEGATLGGFDTWVLVQNPGTSDVEVDFTLNTDQGVKRPAELQDVVIPAGSRKSFQLAKYVQTYDVSTKVEATGGNVICERAVYCSGPGGTWVLGHDSIGY